MNPADAVLAEAEAGAISPQVALARLVLSGCAPNPAALAAAARHRPALADLARLAERQATQLGKLGRIAAQGLDPDGPDMTAATRDLFDRLAGEAPEAAVAFYSLGDPGLLDAATDELASVIRAWSPVAEADILDFGCGIGRVTRALAGEAAFVTGVDLSPAMVAEAQRRTTATNVRYVAGNGADLVFLPSGGVDLVLAADSLPYLVRAGTLDRHMAEFARVLRPGGRLLVFNWSYRGDVGADAREAAALADRHGFVLERSAERPFRIWDGIGFAFRRA